MDSYFLLKLAHILSSVVVAGTGTGIAFFMLMAFHSKNVQAIYVTARHVVLADWLFTAPAVIAQFATGVLLMRKTGYSFTSVWFITTISLFLFIGACWIPVIVIQYKLKALAEISAVNNELHPRFKRLMVAWIALGIPAFLAILIIFWLMVFKPFSVSALAGL